MTEPSQIRVAMGRWKAAGLHLLASLALVLPVVVLTWRMWYPQPWFVVAGGAMLLMLLVGINLAIGPLLTAIVFDPSKRRSSLLLDLAVIMLVQLGAFIYGTHIIINARPVFIVAAVDRYVLVSANEISDQDLARAKSAQFHRLPWTGPRLIGTLPGNGRDQSQRLFDVLAGGKDIDKLPEYYVPWGNVRAAVLAHAKPLTQLHAVDTSQRRRIQALRDLAAANDQTLGFLPMEKGEASYTVIVDMKNGKPLAVLDIDPWQ